MSWLWLAVPLGGLVVAAVLVWAFWSGRIWDGIYSALKRGVTALVIAMLPGILKIFKPASPEELEKFHKRTDRAEDHGLPGQRKREKGW